MKISRSQPNSIIQSVSSNPNGIQFNEIFYTQSIVISNGTATAISNNIHEPKTLEFIENEFKIHPFDFILIGYDYYYQKPVSQIGDFCIKKAIGFEPMTFKSACKTHNLIALDRKFLTLLYTSS